MENSASCEIRSVVKFFNAKNICPAEIYRQVCEVYGENAMRDGMVRRWCRKFSEGRTNVCNDDRSGRPSVVTADLLDQVNEKIRENKLHLCLHLKRLLAAERSNSDDEVKTAVQR
jgi:transposase